MRNDGSVFNYTINHLEITSRLLKRHSYEAEFTLKSANTVTTFFGGRSNYCGAGIMKNNHLFLVQLLVHTVRTTDK